MGEQDRACETINIRDCTIITVCPPSSNAGSGPRGSGQINTIVRGDEVIYRYSSPIGGGFTVRAKLDVLSDPYCTGAAREALVGLLVKHLSQDPGLPRIMFIVEQKMFG